MQVLYSITSVALEVVENKGLKNTVVFFSVASFGKCFVSNELIFSRRAKRTGKSVGFQGSARTFDQAAVARDGLGGLLRVGVTEAAGGVCGRPGTYGASRCVSGLGHP